MSRQETMQLIDSDTRKPLVLGQSVYLSDGRAELISWQTPHKPSSTGRVTVRLSDGKTREYFPSVIGAEFFPRHDQED